MNEPRGPVLFVSHHSSQLEVAEHVEKALNAKGVRCWIAPRDVEPGASFARAIPDAIGESSAVLLLFSAASVKSPHVERELILADQLNKTIIPLRIEKVVDPGGLRYHLAAAQWIDWLEQRDAAIDRIAARAREFEQDTVRSELPREPQSPAPSDGGMAGGGWAAHQAMPAHDPASHLPPPAPPLPSGGGYGYGHGYGHPGPPQGHPGGGGGNKWLWIALGGLAALALIVTIILVASQGTSDPESPAVADYSPSQTGNVAAPAPALNTSVADTEETAADEAETADAVTEEWFSGVWSDTRDCAEPYRFDAGGVLTAPTGNQGRWTIESGGILVVEAGGETIRRALRRVSEDEVMAAGEPIYRCLPTGEDS